jgi:hypothetical protein
MHIETLDRMDTGETIIGMVQAGFELTAMEPIKTLTKDTAAFTASHG